MVLPCSNKAKRALDSARLHLRMVRKEQCSLIPVPDYRRRNPCEEWAEPPRMRRQRFETENPAKPGHFGEATKDFERCSIPIYKPPYSHHKSTQFSNSTSFYLHKIPSSSQILSAVHLIKHPDNEHHNALRYSFHRGSCFPCVRDRRIGPYP